MFWFRDVKVDKLFKTPNVLIKKDHIFLEGTFFNLKTNVLII